MELNLMPSAGTNKFLFDSRGFGPIDYEERREMEENPESEGEPYDTIWCMEIATGEYWPLEINTDLSGTKLSDGRLSAYDMAADGEFLFTCAPWEKGQTCWRIICDEKGRPVSLELISENIMKK